MNNPTNFSYSQIRFAWLKARLVNFLKRWAIYLVIALIVLGGSLSGTVALASLFVAPLLQAPQQSLLYAFLIFLGYGVLGGLIIWRLSSLILPLDWAEAERALPVDQVEQTKSDLLVITLCLAPLIALYALGSVIWFLKFPAWLQEDWGKSILILFGSIGFSILLGYAILNSLRDSGSVSIFSLPVHPPKSPTDFLSYKQPSLTSLMALVILPMVRGSAQRSAKLYLYTLVLLLGCVVALLLLPKWGSWALASFAICSQIMLNRLNVEVKLEMTLISEACNYLPLQSGWLNKALRYFVLMPYVLGILFLCAGLMISEVQISYLVLSVFLLFGFFGNLALIVSSSKPPMLGQREDPAANVSWWLLILAVSIALSTEVLI